MNMAMAVMQSWTLFIAAGALERSTRNAGLRSMRLTKWRTLIGKYILDRWGVVLAFQSFGDKHKAYYKSAFPITGQSPEVIEANTRKQKMCSASKRWAPSSRVVHLGPKLLACRAAGGMRQGGSMMQMDSDTLECRTRTAPLS